MNFFGEKIIFSSAPVPGINNDQSFISIKLKCLCSERYSVFHHLNGYLRYAYGAYSLISSVYGHPSSLFNWQGVC